MSDKIEVLGAPVVYSTEKPPPYNPLHRPPISYKKPIVLLILYLIAVGGLFAIPTQPLFPQWVLPLGFSVVYIGGLLKKTIIWCIHLYQNKASDETRLRCVFEPSCSEYMILAIEKYGLWRGLFKGLRRLSRCHPPNGGKDYP